MSRLVKIYRSPIRQGLYLYVDFKEELQRVPEALLKRFGKPIEAMSLKLTPMRKLARADADSVLRNIEEAGYYLQLPPGDEVR
ncbi:MAG: YcgL domain-containing protein [Gammaproteobacteria bacterium]|nr:YcgL domain-containing protein [Gammaproteobacteria bacterium]